MTQENTTVPESPTPENQSQEPLSEKKTSFLDEILGNDQPRPAIEEEGPEAPDQQPQPQPQAQQPQADQPKKAEATGLPEPALLAAGIINTVELLTSTITAVVAGDVSSSGQFAFDPHGKALAVKSWEAWLKTLKIETDVLWLPAVSSLVILIGASVLKGMQEKKRRKQYPEAYERQQAQHAAQAQQQVQQAQAPDEATNTDELERKIQAVNLTVADFSTQDENRKGYQYDKETLFYTKDKESGNHLKIPQRTEKIPPKIRALVDLGCNAPTIRKLIDSAKFPGRK